MSRLLPLCLLLFPLLADAQACGTYFVDSNTPAGNLRRAIDDVNSLGCTSGGLNTILIDNGPGAFGDTVISTPLPTINRPTEIRLSSPASGRHVIRSNNATQTSIGFALRASARVQINDIDIQGGGGRAFFGGILLEGNANNSLILGVRVENVRNQGISVLGVNGVEIRRSASRPTKVLNSGFGLNLDNPQWEAAIRVSGAINTIIRGTFLGVREDGTAAGNCSYGIEIVNSTALVIGGEQSQITQRNHIGFNNYGGIRVSNSSLVSIHGNYIGLAANGQGNAGNGFGTCFANNVNLPRGGIHASGSNLLLIGGISGQGNVITSNQQGIVINDSHDVNIQRNLIGQRPTGQSASNNDNAIRIENLSGLNGTVTICGDGDAGNILRGSPGSSSGVSVASNVGRVDIRRNSIRGFTTSAIDREFGPVPPVVHVADTSLGMVFGALTPVNAPGEVDLFVDTESQARWYVGTVAVAANASSFEASIDAPEFIDGRMLTATFTRLDTPGPGTSRLSSAVTITGNERIFASGFEAPAF